MNGTHLLACTQEGGTCGEAGHFVFFSSRIAHAATWSKPEWARDAGTTLGDRFGILGAWIHVQELNKTSTQRSETCPIVLLLQGIQS